MHMHFKKSHLLITFICIFITTHAFTLNIFVNVHAEQQTTGIERLKAGIESYENGSYEDAIFNLEIALNELPDDDKENTWEAHF